MRVGRPVNLYRYNNISSDLVGSYSCSCNVKILSQPQKKPRLTPSEKKKLSSLTNLIGKICILGFSALTPMMTRFVAFTKNGHSTTPDFITSISF